MSNYERKEIKCITCGKMIGEAERDAKILFSRCAHCSDPDSRENEVFSYLTDRFENVIKTVLVCRQSLKVT